MTITLTKPIRVGGVEVSGTQTYAADVEADLISRGSATPVFLAPGSVAPGANHIAEHRALGGVANQIAAIGTPFVIPPGDGASAGLLFTGSSGAFTLSAAIVANAWNALKGCWCYMPASFGGSAYPTGWYWAVFTSDTAGTLYTDTYVSGIPARPATPTAFPVNLSGRLTQTTSEVTGPTGFVLPAGSVGPSGTIKAHFRTLGTTVGTKTIKAYLDSTVIFGAAPAGSPVAEYFVSCRNQGAENLQLTTANSSSLTGVGASAATFSTANYTAVDLSVDRIFSMSLQASTTATCAILLHADVTATYGA